MRVTVRVFAQVTMTSTDREASGASRTAAAFTGCGNARFTARMVTKATIARHVSTNVVLQNVHSKWHGTRNNALLVFIERGGSVAARTWFNVFDAFARRSINANVGTPRWGNRRRTCARS